MMKNYKKPEFVIEEALSVESVFAASGNEPGPIKCQGGYTSPSALWDGTLQPNCIGCEFYKGLFFAKCTWDGWDS